MIPPTVVITLDLELSWGTFDLCFNDKLLEMSRWTHDVGVPNLLSHLVRNDISATWAIVGAVTQRSLPDVSGLPAISYDHFSKPWFSYVPKHGDETSHPEWFGASLVEAIRRTKPHQEIGFHSFSHVPFGYAGMTRQRAIAEYQYCVHMARALGIGTTSFVFPRNLVGYLAELRDAGFTCFRDVDQLPIRSSSRKARSLWMLAADLMGMPPSTVVPTFKEGLVSIPGSMMIRYAEGWRKYIPDAMRRRRLRKGLDRVRSNGGVFHVWFHPENLYPEWPRVENVVAHFLDQLGAMIRAGDVRCMTMGQLANEFRAESAAVSSNASESWGSKQVELLA